MRHALFALLSLMLLTGCNSARTDQVRITYYSDPPGATLYENDIPRGRTPFTLTYNLPDHLKNETHITLPNASVVWPSGASASVNSPQINRSLGTNHQYHFARPNMPGREQDILFSMELERNWIMQQQAEAMQRQARSQQHMEMWQLYNSLQQQNQQRRQINRPLHCTTHRFGNTYDTSCY